MDLETVRAAAAALVASYVFLITIWAIALPSIRENDGEGVEAFVYLAELIGASLFIVIVSGGIYAGAGTQIDIDFTWATFFFFLASTAPFAIIGFSLVMMLIGLSYPKK